MTKDALIVFLKSPEHGWVKTRLAARLGNDVALGLYLAFLEDLADLARSFVEKTFVVYDGIEENPPQAFAGMPFFKQRGADMGEKMASALADVFKMGFDRAVLIGSDLPDLPANHLHQALKKLADTPLVLGPATDGGYYLIGCRKETFSRALFSDIHWSGPTVLSETLARAYAVGLQTALIDPWPDIDTVEDLKRFYLRNAQTGRAPHTMQFLKQQEAEHGLRL